MSFNSEDREKLGRIEQHLVQINGRLDRHDEDIDSLKDSVNWNENKIYLGIGGVCALVLVLQVVFGI